MTEREHIELDKDVRSTAELIDSAAELVRGEPGGGFEDRLFMATRSAKPARRRARFVSALKIAAVLGLVGGAVAIMTIRTPVGGETELAALEADLDEWFELTTAFDNGWSSGLDATATEVSMLSTQGIGEFIDEENL